MQVYRRQSNTFEGSCLLIPRKKSDLRSWLCRPFPGGFREPAFFVQSVASITYTGISLRWWTLRFGSDARLARFAFPHIIFHDLWRVQKEPIRAVFRREKRGSHYREEVCWKKTFVLERRITAPWSWVARLTALKCWHLYVGRSSYFWVPGYPHQTATHFQVQRIFKYIHLKSYSYI